MNILTNHNKEVEKRFDEEFEESGVIGDRTLGEYLPNTYKALKQFITSQNKALVQTMAEDEIEMLKKQRISLFGMTSDKDKLEYGGFNQALEDQIERWQNILKELTKEK